MRSPFIPRVVLLCLATWAAYFPGVEIHLPAARAEDASPFFAIPPDPSAELPENGIYPNGRRLAFMGYSGKPDRDLKAGFTVAGPTYGNQAPYVEACIHKGFPVVVHVGGALVHGGFVHGAAGPKYDPEKVRAEVKAAVDRYAPSDAVLWWAVTPEELRPWRKDEMAYLALVTKTVHENDTKKRPIFIYNPNNRDAGTLSSIAKYVDILGKGTYVNLWGKKNEREWVHWSIEQEIAGARQAGRPCVPILMPELCADPPAAERDMIEPWVRHDVYLGMCSGARGVMIWSLFPRGGVKATWKQWYDAYARCGRELGKSRHLGEVFLFGESRHDLKVEPIDGPTTTAGTLGAPGKTEDADGEGEAATTTVEERAHRATKYPAFTTCERAFGARRYLFIVNSTAKPAHFRISGWPAAAVAADAFTGAATVLPPDAPRKLTLPAWGVEGMVLEKGR